MHLTQDELVTHQQQTQHQGEGILDVHDVDLVDQPEEEPVDQPADDPQVCCEPSWRFFLAFKSAEGRTSLDEKTYLSFF